MFLACDGPHTSRNNVFRPETRCLPLPGPRVPAAVQAPVVITVLNNMVSVLLQSVRQLALPTCAGLKARVLPILSRHHRQRYKFCLVEMNNPLLCAGLQMKR